MKHRSRSGAPHPSGTRFEGVAVDNPRWHLTETDSSGLASGDTPGQSPGIVGGSDEVPAPALAGEIAGTCIGVSV